MGGKGYSRQAAASSVYPGKKGTGDWEDSDRGAGNKAARRSGKKVEKKSPTYLAHVHNKEEIDPTVQNALDELNRYGKETGKATGSLNKRPGTPVKKGGTSSPVMQAVRTKIRQETGKPAGQTRRDHDARHSGQDRKESPASTIAKRRQSKADADAAMRDTRGT